MTNDSFVAASSEPIEDFGTIVNDWEPSTDEVDVIPDQHPQDLPLDLEKVICWFSPEQYDSLQRAAEFLRVSIEEHVAQIVINSLNTKVGAPRISAPGSLSGTPTGLISAPTYSVTRG
jgi:hypothetical protein